MHPRGREKVFFDFLIKRVRFQFFFAILVLHFNCCISQPHFFILISARTFCCLISLVVYGTFLVIGFWRSRFYQPNSVFDFYFAISAAPFQQANSVKCGGISPCYFLSACCKPIFISAVDFESCISGVPFPCPVPRHMPTGL